MSRLFYNAFKRLSFARQTYLGKLRSYWTAEARKQTRHDNNNNINNQGLPGGSPVTNQSRTFWYHDSHSRYNVFRRPRVWFFGFGVGLAIVFGLKEIVFVVNKSKCQEEGAADEGTKDKSRYADAIGVSYDLLQRKKDEVGAPGIVVGVSVDGKQVWTEGLGYADVENRVPCKPETVMRIASISKSLTMAAVAKLWEEGKLELDAPVQKYVPEFPEKEYEGEPVTITTKMLVSHLSGIRHYEKDPKKVKDEKEKLNRDLEGDKKTGTTGSEEKEVEDEEKDKQPGMRQSSIAKPEDMKCSNAKNPAKKKELEQEEYYLKVKFENVIQALNLFKNDPLIFKPGSQFLYSTHAFTLLSAVVERASGQKFLDHMMKLFRELGMLNTVPDKNDPIIYNRSRFYAFNKRGRLVNCPYVDNSYKWAGGGFLSTVGDLLLFGNAMLYSYQALHFKGRAESTLLPGYLRPDTIKTMWTPVDKTEMSWDKDGKYGMGWAVVEKKQQCGQCRSLRHYVSHTGGAVGASSVLLVLPECSERAAVSTWGSPPRGVVVTIICNMQSAGLNSTALKIALEFEKAQTL
ncbi:serine beta-lactamase-like protein LACTB [Huso huso]|uniref:Serine beta-lactamase-like protein LACTB n=1 Tax=Huso huso TaxID=61971 RepID=A0ABR0YRL8_HUSHU